MKISDNIKKLQDYMKEYGDVELFFEDNDGRSTTILPYTIKINKINMAQKDILGHQTGTTIAYYMAQSRYGE